MRENGVRIPVDYYSLSGFDITYSHHTKAFKKIFKQKLKDFSKKMWKNCKNYSSEEKIEKGEESPLLHCEIFGAENCGPRCPKFLKRAYVVFSLCSFLPLLNDIRDKSHVPRSLYRNRKTTLFLGCQSELLWRIDFSLGIEKTPKKIRVFIVKTLEFLSHCLFLIARLHKKNNKEKGRNEANIFLQKVLPSFKAIQEKPF